MDAQDSTKKCPFCGEQILAVAIKCKHCGEMLNPAGSPSKPAPPTTPKQANVVLAKLKSPAVRRRIILAAAVLLGLGVIGGLASTLKESALWVRMHSDVEWHRGWQDAHVEKERPRVIEIYKALGDTHPDDPNYRYLAIRALQSGAEQTTAFEQAAKAFPKNPWIAWGVASAHDDRDGELNALRLFGPSPASSLLRNVIAECIKEPKDWNTLQAVWSAYSTPIASNVDTVFAMVDAEFQRGNQDGALKWLARAERLGGHPNDAFTATIRGMKALGIRPDVNGLVGYTNNAMGVTDKALAEALGHMNGTFQITGVSVTEEGSDFNLMLYVRLLQTSEETWQIGVRDSRLTAKSGQSISTFKNYSIDVHSGSWEKFGLGFRVPAGQEVSQLVFPTDRIFLKTGEKITFFVDLDRPKDAAPIKGIDPPL